MALLGITAISNWVCFTTIC